MFRNNEICVDNEVQFYIGLRRRQIIRNIVGATTITTDEVANGDLRNLYTTQNPEWVVAWDKREKARQDHKKVLDGIESEAVGLSPDSAAPVVAGETKQR